MAILQKRYPHPSPHLQIRHSLIHPFLPQDKLLIQMHLDVLCNAWPSCQQGEGVCVTHIYIKGQVDRMCARQREADCVRAPLLFVYVLHRLSDGQEGNYGNFAKRYPHPSPHLQIRPSLVHPFLPQDKLLIQMHLDVPCNAQASFQYKYPHSSFSPTR